MPSFKVESSGPGAFVLRLLVSSWVYFWPGETTLSAGTGDVVRVRFERWNQLKKQYYGKITVELGKEFLADHYDAMKKEYGPDVRRTLCGHGELGGGTSGAVDGKVTSASLAKEMKFWARFGHPCGTPISSTEYFAQYPDKNAWLKPWNFSMPVQEWTVLGPRGETQAVK